MTPDNTFTMLRLFALTACLFGCNAHSNVSADDTRWPALADTDIGSQGQHVTVIIALSSVVPGGIVGHAGIAVEDQYWDFGPQRTDLLQPLKSMRSEAGPWWDDPDQLWADDRSLHDVLSLMPEKVHPQGSLVAVFQLQVTDDQARAITAFWQDTYARMRLGEDTYRLTARQCASMVGWSLKVGLINGHASDRLPRDMYLMTPTHLYEELRATLRHTAGPDEGQPADLTLWQLKREGLRPWQRPLITEQLDLPELPRLRLAIERIKHLPAGVRQRR